MKSSEKDNKQIIHTLKDLLLVLNFLFLTLVFLFSLTWFVTFPVLSSFLFWFLVLLSLGLGYAHWWLIKNTVDLNQLKKFITRDVKF